ncbi:methyltransferase domain-containing protein [Roseibacterium beibuensis]|uniref:Methyltransferase domain-containing protein n=1 Tax=[Roseibacterium] beibuensis TaxID=1193142 RepID=A0ABP9LEI4_9RHOB|nr:class I SAM-dependent methyltransferase [Roseibacterium beibuensis]MCS6623654.1 methyltransferase domain-containing protein [Roseibacterium beibuensis]
MTRSGTNAKAAAAYYNEDTVAAFYRSAWGGEDIHIGRYDTGAETVRDASRAMTRHLLSLARLRPGDTVLDIACGYGGTLRELARSGCVVHGIDISRVCVEEARRANAAAGLADRISVQIGDFHDLPFEPATLSACICQESIIHSTDRPRVFAEVFRVLRSRGVFAFSDILTTEGANLDLVNAAFARLGVTGGATRGDYERMAREAGFDIVQSGERQDDIRTHYDKLAERLEDPLPGVSPEAADGIAASIERWQRALEGGHITWACFVAKKPG